MSDSGVRSPTAAVTAADKPALVGETLSISKTEALDAIRRVADSIGLGQDDLLLLEALCSFTQRQDWVAGCLPVVWPSNEQLCELSGLSKPAVKFHMARLVEAGLVTFKTSRDGKRYGRRDAQGLITEAYGFDLSPLCARTPELEWLYEAMEQERELALSADGKMGQLNEKLLRLIDTVTYDLPASVLSAMRARLQNFVTAFTIRRTNQLQLNDRQFDDSVFDDQKFSRLLTSKSIAPQMNNTGSLLIMFHSFFGFWVERQPALSQSDQPESAETPQPVLANPRPIHHHISPRKPKSRPRRKEEVSLTPVLDRAKDRAQLAQTASEAIAPCAHAGKGGVQNRPDKALVHYSTLPLEFDPPVSINLPLERSNASLVRTKAIYAPFVAVPSLRTFGVPPHDTGNSQPSQRYLASNCDPYRR